MTDPIKIMHRLIENYKVIRFSDLTMSNEGISIQVSLSAAGQIIQFELPLEGDYETVETELKRRILNRLDNMVDYHEGMVNVLNRQKENYL